MTGSHFVRRVPRYPVRFLLPTGPKPIGLERRVPVRPARFVVGLDELVDSEEDRALPPIPVQSAPLRVASYLGRVEEVDPAGALTATVWEIPSGREAITTLSPADSAIVGTFEPMPQSGDLLRIWTWIEFPLGGAEEHRVFFKIEEDETDETAGEEPERRADPSGAPDGGVG